MTGARHLGVVATVVGLLVGSAGCAGDDRDDDGVHLAA